MGHVQGMAASVAALPRCRDVLPRGRAVAAPRRRREVSTAPGEAADRERGPLRGTPFPFQRRASGDEPGNWSETIALAV